MPLNWNAERCKPVAPIDDRDGDWREFLIWATMSVGLCSVTAKNIEEWLFRLKFLNHVGLGEDSLTYYVEGNREKVPLTAAVLRRWIGLGTNASEMTRSQFVKNTVAQVERRVSSQVRSALREEEAA